MLETVTARRPETKVVLITACATIEVAREAQAKGVYDFTAKPLEGERVDVIATKPPSRLQVGAR